MSENILKARLLHPCKKDAEWASSNPVAKKGEIMISSDKTGMFKVGDGTSKWNQLNYNHVTWGNVEGKPTTFTPSSHTHTKSQITDFPSSLKNPNSISIQLNGGTATAYDGSVAKSINITPSSIGAATSSHTHSQYYDNGVSRTANTVLAAPNGSNGGATFRKLVAADIPSLSYLPLSGGTVTGSTIFNKGLTVKNAGLELYYTTPFIDFHHDNSTDDYTSRIIENSSGVLNINGATFTNGGAVWCTSFSTDGKGTFGGDLSATRGLFLKHGGTSLYLYNENGNFVIMHTGTDGKSGWPIIWNFANGDLSFSGNATFSGTKNSPITINGVVGNESSIIYKYGGNTNNSWVVGPGAGTSDFNHFGFYKGDVGTVAFLESKGRLRLKHSVRCIGHSVTWIEGAQPSGGSSFESIYDPSADGASDSALVPGWRIRNYSGAWVGASYNLGRSFHLYYCDAARLTSNTNGTDADFVFQGQTGAFLAKTITQTSDERRKSIISSSILSTYKDFFMKIKPFSFKWKDGQDDTAIHLGVGAQTVYQTALDCGFEENDIGLVQRGKEYPGTSIPWSVSYSEFIPLNIAMTQNHESRIEKLEQENEELKQQIKELKGLTV